MLAAETTVNVPMWLRRVTREMSAPPRPCGRGHYCPSAAAYPADGGWTPVDRRSSLEPVVVAGSTPRQQGFRADEQHARAEADGGVGCE